MAPKRKPKAARHSRSHGKGKVKRWPTRRERVRELEETAPERWRYFVYRDGKRTELTKEQYERLNRPGSEEQG